MCIHPSTLTMRTHELRGRVKRATWAIFIFHALASSSPASETRLSYINRVRAVPIYTAVCPSSPRSCNDVSAHSGKGRLRYRPPSRITTRGRATWRSRWGAKNFKGRTRGQLCFTAGHARTHHRRWQLCRCRLREVRERPPFIVDKSTVQV